MTLTYPSLTNQPPMSIKWPVNKQPTADQIFLRDGSPVPAVVTVVAVVPHRQIAMSGHRISAARRRKEVAAQGITGIWSFRFHYSAESKSLRKFAINIQIWWLDSQSVP